MVRIIVKIQLNSLKEDSNYHKIDDILNYFKLTLSTNTETTRLLSYINEVLDDLWTIYVREGERANQRRLQPFRLNK